MQINLDLFELKNLIMEMSEIGAANYAKNAAPTSDYISEREAFRRFGEGNVKGWAIAGMVKFKRMGSGKNSKKRYSYSELLTVKKAEELLTGKKPEKSKKVKLI